MPSVATYLAQVIAGLIAGRSAPAYDGVGGASTTVSDLFVGQARNTAGWWGTTDLTCIPQSGGNNGVLVTPRDMLFAAHFGSPPSVTFLGSDGVAYARAVAQARQVGQTDVLVATLAADLPSAVTPALLPPAGWMANFPVGGNPPYPCVFTNQDRRLLLADYEGFQYGGSGPDVEDDVVLDRSADPGRSPWWYAARANDSGSPAFLLFGTSLVAVGQLHSIGGNAGASGYYTADADYLSGINAAIAANGSPHAVATIDLTTAVPSAPSTMPTPTSILGASVDGLLGLSVDQILGLSLDPAVGLVPVTITVLPPAGPGLPYTAVVLDQFGGPVTGATVTWAYITVAESIGLTTGLPVPGGKAVQATSGSAVGVLLVPDEASPPVIQFLASGAVVVSGQPFSFAGGAWQPGT